MLQRWLVVLIGLPALLAVLLICPPWATALLVCAIAGVAAWELLHTAGRRVTKPVYVLTVLCAVRQVWAVYAHRALLDTEIAFPHLEESRAAELWLAPFLLTMLLFFLAVRSYGTDKAIPFSDVSAALVGGVAFPMMYSCIVLLRMTWQYGRLFVLAPFFVAFAGDSLAMYFGMWFGKKKLTPVSPKKTWAGFWGNLLGSGVGMLAFGLLGAKWLGYAPNYPLLLLIGAAANLFGQLGDLSMSLIKREHGVKDYSRLFLTHGGVLDRFDSTMFIAPVLYYILNMGVL